MAAEISQGHSVRSAGVKRLLREAKELCEPTSLFYARPLEDNLFEWHFTFRGPDDSDYADGIYHGRIVLPHEYPMKPPNVYLLTDNGRFETNTKICLSISGYHPETWLPSWSIRTAILALIAFFPSDGAGAVGSIECTKEARQRLAKRSHSYRCETCGCTMRDLLPSADESAPSAAVAAPSAQAADASPPLSPPSGTPITAHGDAAAADDASPSQSRAAEVPSAVSHAPTRQTRQVSPPPSSTGLIYGFCVLTCLIAFLALLTRRLIS